MFMATILAHYKGLGLNETMFHSLFQQTPRPLGQLNGPLELKLNANTNRPITVEITDWKDPDHDKEYVQIKAARWNMEIDELLKTTTDAYYKNPTAHNFTVHLSAAISYSNEWTRNATYCTIDKTGNVQTKVDDKQLIDVLNNPQDYVLIYAHIKDNP